MVQVFDVDEEPSADSRSPFLTLIVDVGDDFGDACDFFVGTEPTATSYCAHSSGLTLANILTICFVVGLKGFGTCYDLMDGTDVQ